MPGQVPRGVARHLLLLELLDDFRGLGGSGVKRFL
jgi:hypothetical protein